MQKFHFSAHLYGLAPFHSVIIIMVFSAGAASADESTFHPVAERGRRGKVDEITLSLISVISRQGTERSFEHFLFFAPSTLTSSSIHRQNSVSISSGGFY